MNELKRPDIKKMHFAAPFLGPGCDDVKALCLYALALEQAVYYFVDERVKIYCGEIKEDELHPEEYMFSDAPAGVHIALKARREKPNE